MMKYNAKQKIAAMLCAAMLFGQAVPAAYAQDQNLEGQGSGDVVATETTPPAAEETTPPPATETTPPPASEETTPPPVTEETTPPATEETTPPPATEETTPPPAAEETTPPPVTQETTPLQQPGEGFNGGAGFGTFNLVRKVTPELEDVEYSYEKASSDTANDGEISGRVTFAGTMKLHVEIFPLEGSNPLQGKTLEASGESFTFGGLQAGKYLINYAFDGMDTLEDQHQIEIEAEIAPPQDPEPVPEKKIDVKYTIKDASSATAEDGEIKGDVTSENGTYPLYVELFHRTGTSAIRGETLGSADTTFVFDRLPSGEYVINYAFEGSQMPDRQETVTVQHAVRAAIAITGVKEGEKTLTVKGTAQAGSVIQAETTPALQKAVMVVGDNGSFEWILAAEPGTYTQVRVFYANDESGGDSKTGSWTVSAPAAAPTITVDPVDINSRTVVVKTGAKLPVTLKTPDSTQTLESSEEGLVRFSLTHTYLKGDEFIITVAYGSGSGKIVSQKVTVGGVGNYNDLEYGDYGDEVLRLTTRLNQLGYPIAPTKDYNSAVREAVRLFQIANGQEADGEAGDRMQAALYSVGAIRYGSGRYPTLVRGDKGLALIKTLQQRLKDLGYYTIKVDGIFGSGTQRAVRLFQQINGLPDTGIADNATQVLLYSSSAKPLGYAPAGGYSTLQRSSKYKSAVVPLQRRLRELGYYSGSIDGYFGSKTYRAVRNFQSRNGLKATGVADAKTQQVLYSAAAKKYNGTAAGTSGTTTGYRLLYWGCRGEEVVHLQSALISAGYKSYVRSADGIFGQWTYDAVCAYQRDHGLTVDGIAGKKTQNSLYGTNY